MVRVELSTRCDQLSQQLSRSDRQLSEAKTRASAAEADLRNIQEHLKTKDHEIKVRSTRPLTRLPQSSLTSV